MPEKAGVGGSTPSLATIIPKQLAESRLALPVRSQSAIFRRDPVRFLATMMVKDLTRIASRSVRFQSASVCGVAENRSQHCPRRSHAILADTVGITLQEGVRFRHSGNIHVRPNSLLALPRHT